MNENVTINIGENIRKLRKEKGLSQDELSALLNTARPVISNWERSTSEPSASQLVKLSKILGVSVDAIVSSGGGQRVVRVVVVDTSILIKRPNILKELPEKFDEVIIPKVVVDELNHQKDTGKPSVKRCTSLVMHMIEGMLDSVIIKETNDNSGKNDEKIANIAKERARIFSDRVYLFADDIWFSFLIKGAHSNLSLLRYKDYIAKFIDDKDFFDSEKTQEFLSLLKNRETEKIKKLEYDPAIDINSIDTETGFTPLIYAVRNKNIEIISKLIEKYEVDLNLPDKHKYGFTPLLHAAQINNLSMMKLLVEAGAEIDAVSIGGKNSGNTPLMVCAWHGFCEGAEYLIAQGACLNQQDSNGYTALTKACIKGHDKIAALLVNGTDINILSRENKKAVDYINLNKPYSKELLKLFKEKMK
jgi:ankyrin repeat protein/transcriptional regulator with XRE-family HTH domain